MSKRIVDDSLEFETCPVCGGNSNWVGSEVDRESYYDTYICDKCGKQYTIAFDMSYKAHYIDE
jgi:transcription elongation factor Elf1